MLLIGNQGVGKNKLADYFLQRLKLPREYIQLHRDTTVNQLTTQPSIRGGGLVFDDSPLVRAVREGYVLVIDEINRGNISRIFGELMSACGTIGEYTPSTARAFASTLCQDMTERASELLVADGWSGESDFVAFADQIRLVSPELGAEAVQAEVERMCREDAEGVGGVTWDVRKGYVTNLTPEELLERLV